MKNLIKIFLLLTFAAASVNLHAQSSQYFLKENMDFSVKPTDDFFNYANGTFIKNHPIPSYEAVYGIFNVVTDSVYEYLRQICEESLKDTKAVKGTNVQKIRDFYFSGLDSAGMEKEKLNPLKSRLESIDKISDKKSLEHLIAMMQTNYIQPLFSPYVGQDLMQSDKYALYIYQGGLGLPEREYYFRSDDRTANIRKEYVMHVQKMLAFTGYSEKDAEKYSRKIMDMETELARVSRKLEDLRDDYANYNKMSLKEFYKTNPKIDWEYIFSEMGVKNTDSVIVGQPEFFTEAGNLFEKYSIDEWKAYLKWNLMHDTAPLLADSYADESFHFFGTVMSGTTEQRPRWKRVLDNTNSHLGEILGQEYVRLHFPPEDKERVKEMVDNLTEAFKERILKLDWMSEETKSKALLKLSTMVKKIGYPDKWKDYSTLEIGKMPYVLNVLNASNWDYEFNIHRLGKPVDRNEWGMYPQTYNAYYNPSNNEIVLPAAQLTIPGKKMSEVDDAFLYGFIGASTIGHEMTHGFDDQGRLYDEKGNLNGWWTAEDSAKFVERTKLIIEQFNNYVVLDSMHINGKATQGENIADLGGLVIGYDAMKKTKDGKDNPEIDGFNADQRFFLGYAYSWAEYYRDEMLAKRALTDVHSPPFLRVNGPMSDIDEFYKAFGMKPGDKMYRAPEIRVHIW